jgi:PAS domain S-box-containing protein
VSDLEPAPGGWLRAFAKASPDAIAVIDSAGRIELVNSAAEALFGFPATEVEGAPIQRILPDIRVVTGAGSHSSSTGLRRDDSRFPARISATPVDSRIILRVQNVSDEEAAQRERVELIARAQRAREEVGRAEGMTNDFLATLSHELRTPLTAMLGWTQILRSHPDEAELGTRAVDTIERNIQVQTRLIEDLLDMSNMAHGRLRLDIHPIVLAPIIDAALERVTPEARSKDITLVRQLEATVPTVLGDSRRLEQVIWNLLSNAVRFTPERGTITVSLRRLGAFARIDIADNGPGIEPELLPRLFDRFRQGDSSSRRSHRGLGLGLSIAKSLVELHGGAVRAESAGPGTGATFTVLLPESSLRDGGADRHGEPRPAQHPLRDGAIDAIRGIRVLVVDDEPDTRDSFRRILEDFGTTVFIAGSAEGALAAIQAHQPDVILCDIGMPGEDGYDLIRKIRALGRRQDREIPAAALTAFDGNADRSKAIESGFQIQVAKPVEPTRLAEVVAWLISQPAG